MCRVPGGGLAEDWPGMPVPAGTDSAELWLLPGRADAQGQPESGSAVPLRGRLARRWAGVTMDWRGMAARGRAARGRGRPRQPSTTSSPRPSPTGRYRRSDQHGITEDSPGMSLAPDLNRQAQTSPHRSRHQRGPEPSPDHLVAAVSARMCLVDSGLLDRWVTAGRARARADSGRRPGSPYARHGPAGPAQGMAAFFAAATAWL